MGTTRAPTADKTDISSSARTGGQNKDSSFDNMLNKAGQSGSDSGQPAQRAVSGKTRPEKSRADKSQQGQPQKPKAADPPKDGPLNQTRALQDTGKDSAKTTDSPAAVQIDETIPAPAPPAKDDSSEDKARLNKANADILKGMSQILQIPENSILQILQQMNLQPVDLLDKSNLNEFVQKAFGVDDAVQLLEIPDIQQVFSQAQQMLAAYETSSPSQPQLTAQAPAARQSGQTLPRGDSAPKPAEQLFVAQNQQQPMTEDNKSQSQGQTKGENNTDPMAVLQNTVPKQAVKAAPADAPHENSFVQNLAAQAVPPAVATAAQSMPAVSAAVSARPVNTAEVIQQIVDQVKVDVTADSSEIKIRLKPEHLGEVTMKIVSQNGVIAAQFQAENQRVKEIIESQFSQLRNTLSAQGINVSQLSVSVGNEAQNLFNRGQQALASRRVARAGSSAQAGEDGADDAQITMDYLDDNSTVQFSA